MSYYNEKFSIDSNEKRESDFSKKCFRLFCASAHRTFYKSTAPAQLHMDPSVSHEPTQLRCDPCQQSFSTKWNLETHYQTRKHLAKVGSAIAEKTLSFICPECGFKYSRQSSLYRHIKGVHNQLTKDFLQCQHCDKSFSNQATLSRHLSSHVPLVPPTVTSISQPDTFPANLVNNLIPAKQSNLMDKERSSLGNSNPPCTTNLRCFLPGVSHCITLVFPSLSDDTRKFADGNDKCSTLDRHGFALVLLACCLYRAIGHCGRLRIIACEALTECLLAECAQLLHLSEDWGNVATSVVRFSNFDSFKNVMMVRGFVTSPMVIHSLFIVSHADNERLRVLFGNERHMLRLSRIVELIHTCEPKQVHLMTCKSKKLSDNLQRKCSKMGICSGMAWCAYGTDDVTTVPFDFGSPLDSGTDWLSVSLEHDFDDVAHTHMTASVQSFLCSLSVSSGYAIEATIRSVLVPIHSKGRLELCPGVISPPSSVLGQVDTLYPFCSELTPVLAQIGVSWAKYKWYLRKLEMTPGEDFLYLQ